MDIVKVEGLRELDLALAELPKATARNTLNRTLMKAGEFYEGIWRSTAPRMSGHYAESITTSKRLNRTQSRERKQGGKDFAEVYVGTGDPAGMQQEFGNINHPAQPSGRPSWDASKEPVLNIIKTELASEIEKSRARLAKKAAKLAKG